MTRCKDINGLVGFLLLFSYELLMPIHSHLTGAPILSQQVKRDRVTYGDVAEILDRHCITCHNGPNAPLDLRLETYSGILAGSESGPVVVVGKPEESELVLRIRGTSKPRMPFSGPPWLSEEEMALLERWITIGMPKTDKSADEETTHASASRTEAATSSSTVDNVTYDDVAPILKMKCVKCHGSRGLKGPPPENFRLDGYEYIVQADDRVRVVSGDPEASELLRKIRGQSLPRMPLDGPPYLTDQEIALITKWIQQGIQDSKGNPAPLPTGAKVRLHGQLTGVWALDGLPLSLNRNTRLKKSPAIGDYVQVRGRLLPDGKVSVERIRKR